MSKLFRLIWQLLSPILDGLKNSRSSQQEPQSQLDSELSEKSYLKLSVLKVTLRDDTLDTIKGYIEDAPMRWQGIVIHHSLTKDGTSKNWNAIIRYHTNDKGWSDVGYHFGIERVGDEWLVFAGRPLNKRGAHTKELDFNGKFLGICVIGDFDKTEVPEEALSLCESLVEILVEQLDIPVENVLGHGEAQAIGRVAVKDRKSCPGKNFDMKKLRVKLRIANALQTGKRNT